MDHTMIDYGGLKEWIAPVAELLAIGIAAWIGKLLWGNDQ